ncbi:MAG TPA: hypothetical protein ENI63_00755 [Candidatus Kaiserbacteria bacterium]|nr:hypothetical protein [Candidatus Kaiserbacteria bacterium]
MEQAIKNYKIKKQKNKNINNERADLVFRFTQSINKERVGTKYKKLTARGVAIKLGHIPTSDLYFFLKQCDNAKSFGKMFFGCLKYHKK